MLVSILLGLALAAPVKPVAWAAEAIRGRRDVRVTFSTSLHGSAAYGIRDRSGCWTPNPVHAAALGERLGLGAPFAAGAKLQVVLGPRNVVTATITAAEACPNGIEARDTLPMPAPAGLMLGQVLVLPIHARLGAWDGVSAQPAELSTADAAAIAAQFDRRLAGAVKAAKHDPEVAQQLEGLAKARARARIPEPDRIGEMTQQVLAAPGQPKLFAIRVQLSSGAAARADTC